MTPEILATKIAHTARIPLADFIGYRNESVRATIKDRLAFYTCENARHLTARAAVQERRAWNRMRDGLPPVPSILAKGGC